MRFTNIAARSLVAGAAALALAGSGAAQQDDTAERVETLMPQLLSKDEKVRTDAERRLFELGDAGRAELERIAREDDTRRAVAALRLLQSDRWARRGEERARPEQDGDQGERFGRNLDELRDDFEQRIEEVRRQMEEMLGQFSFEAPELPPAGAGARTNTRGTLVEGDRKLSWDIDEAGRVKVTTRDGADAPEQTFEAKSMDELRRDHPEVAKRLEAVLPGGGNGGFVFRFRPRSSWGMDRNGGNGFGPRDRRDDWREPPERAMGQVVLGIEWSPVPDVLREQLDLGGESGMVVERVEPGTRAERIGLRRHDVLLELNGRTVANAEDVRAALADVKEDQKVPAVVLRKGRRQTL